MSLGLPTYLCDRGMSVENQDKHGIDIRYSVSAHKMGGFIEWEMNPLVRSVIGYEGRVSFRVPW